MVPTSIGTFCLFLILVVPGIAFEITYERSRPPRPVTVFREICNITLVGTLASVISVSALLLVQFWFPHALINVSRWIHAPHQYETDHAGRIFILFIVATSISCLIAFCLAKIFEARRPELKGSGFNKHSSLHFAILTGSTDKNALTQLQIQTTSATIGGTFECFDESSSRDEGWIVLRNVHYVVNGSKQYASPWQRIVIPYSEIVSILSQFIPNYEDNSGVSDGADSV